MKSVISRLDLVLKPFGLCRHKHTWNRRVGSFVDVIDVQISKARDRLTINVGVSHPEIYRKVWAAEPKAVVYQPSSIVRARIGQLLNGRDPWWRLDDTGMLDDMVEKLRAHVLPFVERMHSFEAMEQFLATAQMTGWGYPPPVISLAILKNERGDKAGACALLAELANKPVGAWKDRIDDVAAQLGCSRDA